MSESHPLEPFLYYFHHVAAVAARTTVRLGGDGQPVGGLLTPPLIIIPCGVYLFYVTVYVFNASSV